MDDTKDKHQRVHEAIRQILLNDWDPIGVKEWPEAQDEYDSYVGGVYRLLATGATERQMVDHLDRIESQQMLIPRKDKTTLLPVAQKLLAVNLHLQVK